MKNSTHSQGQTSKFTVSELCAILKACGTSAVAELKFGDLHVIFGPRPEVITVSEHRTPLVLPMEKELMPDPATEIAATQEKIARESLELDEIQNKEDQLALLAIEDPVTYEELLANGELDEDARLRGDEDEL